MEPLIKQRMPYVACIQYLYSDHTHETSGGVQVMISFQTHLYPKPFLSQFWQFQSLPNQTLICAFIAKYVFIYCAFSKRIGLFFEGKALTHIALESQLDG